MRRLLLASLFLLVFIPAAFAALVFPALTGRVVDDAGILSAGTQSTLTDTLADFEHKAGVQIVVVTLPTLQDTSIEDFGYQLGRNWGIGEARKDDGVLLIVAPNERKVRIEVGYGLEVSLTDTKSAAIIQDIILPEFRAGRMEYGIIKGVDAIMEVVGGPDAVAPRIPQAFDKLPSMHLSPQNKASLVGGIIVIFALVFLAFWMAVAEYGWDRAHKKQGDSFADDFGSSLFLIIRIIFDIMAMFGSRSSSSSGGGGFSGGGGSFGGGGASGSW